MSLSKIPRILFEDQEILVCHKPSGVPAQTNRIGTPDLVSILKIISGKNPVHLISP